MEGKREMPCLPWNYILCQRGIEVHPWIRNRLLGDGENRRKEKTHGVSITSLQQRRRKGTKGTPSPCWARINTHCHFPLQLSRLKASLFILKAPLLDPHIQPSLVPHEKHLLPFQPPFGLFTQLQVKMPYDPAQDAAEFGVRETALSSTSSAHAHGLPRERDRRKKWQEIVSRMELEKERCFTFCPNSFSCPC